MTKMILERKSGLEARLLERVKAIDASKWVRKDGSYKSYVSLGNPCNVGCYEHETGYHALVAQMGPYTVQLRTEGKSELSLNLYENHSKSPKLKFEGKEVIKLYALKEEEVFVYEEEQKLRRQLQDSSEDPLKGILGKI